MESLTYLYWTSFKNKVIQAMRRPVTYIYVLFICGYFIWLAVLIGGNAKTLHYDTPEGLIIGLTALTLFLAPPGYVNYAKRKGVIFKPGDVHFVFTSPSNPKMVLLFTQLKQYMLSFLLSLAIAVFGCAYFHISPLAMAGYFCISFIVENVIQSCIILLLYGNERLSERAVKGLTKVIWAVLGAMVAFGVLLFFFEEPTLNIIPVFFHHPVLQCIPVIGWNIAFTRLLILGPTTVNVVCSILYLLSAIGLVLAAKRMTCTGGYYEDAMKYADEYQEIIAKKKKGEIGKVGKRAKYKEASVAYKGSCAKAIFYRQLLEYKKSKFFIFGINTLICLIGGGILAFLCYQDRDSLSTAYYFIIPGVSAYLTFVFSGYATKWSKELENPYTYLIPDSQAKKMWYATIIEHIRAAIDGSLLAIPAVIVMKGSLLLLVLYVLIHVCLQANKLYLKVLAQVLLGDTLGNTGKQWFQMLAQMFIIGIGVAFAAVGTLFLGMEAGFAVLIVYILAATIAIAAGGSFAFGKMEL